MAAQMATIQVATFAKLGMLTPNTPYPTLVAAAAQMATTLVAATTASAGSK